MANFLVLCVRLIAVAVVLWIAPPAAGAQPADEVAALNRKFDELFQTGKYAEALPVAQRALALAERRAGAAPLPLAHALNNAGRVHKVAGRYAEAETALKRSLAIREKALGPNHADVGACIHYLAELRIAQGRNAEADSYLKRALAIREKALGVVHADYGESLHELAFLRENQGNYLEAEQLYKRSRTIMENALGPNHLYVGVALHNLGALYMRTQRYAEAEPVSARALIVLERLLGPSHLFVGQVIGSLGEVARFRGQYKEAEPMMVRALAIIEKSMGPDHPEYAAGLENLARLYQDTGRWAASEPLSKRNLALTEKALGPNHPRMGAALSNWGQLNVALGKYAEADRAHKRALAIFEKALGPDHPDVGVALSNLAIVNVMQQNWGAAVGYYERASNVITRRVLRDRDSFGRMLSGRVTSQSSQQRFVFSYLAAAAYRWGLQEPARAGDLSRQAFAAAQWALGTEAAQSVGQMAAREAKGDTALARLVRERQDLVADWQSRDAALTGAVSAPPEQRDAAAEQATRSRLVSLDVRISEIDKLLAKEFPEYASLASPEPLSVVEARDLLKDNEALVLFLDSVGFLRLQEESFVWVLTKTGARWLHIPLGTRAIYEQVRALRCGLDHTSWDGEAAAHCASLLKRTLSSADATAGKPLPFDLARAHDLYKALFGGVEDLIRDKHLLIVPPLPLTSLPFHVLVTEKPQDALPADAAGYANAAWLAKRNAVTILPSVASLKALRRLAKPSKATSPFIGFGNPLLSGPGGSDRRAWERQTCTKTSPGAMRVASRAVRAPAARFLRNGLADVDTVRAQYPLPETADELCAVARSAGSPESEVYLGERATEAGVKALSASGALARARVVHFATHGLLAGETEMLVSSKAEPSLILSPPQRPSELDDGLLTAAEVSQLKLDADWVVLSACNTAAGSGSSGRGVEALSGLARAFFYAGARALLVSHWAVDSEATVKLVTRAFDEIKESGTVGRSQALRRSMLALIGSGGRNAHPASWAPFVVVGEGAR